ncbi:MAG: hypothetical protein KJ607_07585, partial [Bacteroidetes bacterium]|nr:hypothetical protein [Bacteroidota bacterium]
TLIVSGITPSGNDTVLIDSLNADSTDIYNLTDYFNGADYPRLKMQLYTHDTTTRTPDQLKKWQLTYDEAPETALNPSRGYYFYGDTLQEGDNLYFSVATENISAYDMDSLLIRYFYIDRHNQVHSLGYKRYRPHPAGDILVADTVTVSTVGLSGLNSIWIEVNPKDTVTGQYDQLEQYHHNNIAAKFFYVERDKTNPLLDVTFDGVHILDGDIVSASPDILIKLKDENRFLALNDPSLFRLYIRTPAINDYIEISFSDPDYSSLLKWTPAQLPDNSCEIFYTPEFTEDGTYSLKVEAMDVSTNASGDENFEINFEVITAASITNIFNYPNPFSTSTRFVFELTGSEIPDDFRIQVLTVTGKLVKTIGLDELGSIHIGRNITDYAWNGTDDFGDLLANGVYFYRVITKLNGENIEKRETAADHYFKKGFGKMYIMR